MRKPSVRSGVAAMALFTGLSVHLATAAPPRTVEAFDAATWKALQAQATQPTVVVFTTTDCAHCPAVFKQLGQAIQKRQIKGQLMAVVMDQAPGEDDAALRNSPHYAGVQRLFAFAGQAPAIRYAVDPSWRGVTPYTVYLAPKNAPVAVMGPPTSADLAAWARLGSGAPAN
jgi:hypothetical protein